MSIPEVIRFYREEWLKAKRLYWQGRKTEEDYKAYLQARANWQTIRKAYSHAA